MNLGIYFLSARNALAVENSNLHWNVGLDQWE